MKKRIYYSIARIFYHIKEGNNPIFEYFWCKAESIAEEEYNKEVTDFYEG